jgi:parvulin-like peptidyl-prolyl isomerase
LSRRAQVAPSRTYPWSTIDPERRNSILLVGSIVIIIVAAFIMAGYGYYKDKLQYKHEAVLTVGNRTFDYESLLRRTRAETIKNALDPAKVQDNIENTLAKMEEEELVRQAARRANVTATNEEMQAGYRARLGLAPTTDANTVTQLMRSELNTTGLNLDDMKDIVLSQVLDKKMNDQVKAVLPASSEHVNLGLIEVDGEGKALQIRQRIDGGESFNTIAAKESTHPSKDKAGDLGWVSRGSLPAAVEKVAFEQFALSDVVSTDAGYFILAIRDKQTREITDDEKDLIAQESRQEVLDRTRTNVGIDVALTKGQETRIAQTLGARSVPGA